jgi:hypothetical protein
MPIDVKKAVAEVQEALAKAVEENRLDGGRERAALLELPPKEFAVAFLVAQGCSREWAEQHVVDARYDENGDCIYTLSMPPISYWRGTFELAPGNA